MKRQSAAAPIVAALALCLTGCNGVLAGFTPMYGIPGVSPALSRIDTPTPSGRTGQFLREALDDDLAKDRGQPPLYRLRLVLKETRVPRGLRIDNVADRYEFRLRVSYVLVDLQTRQNVKYGTVATTLSYDSADQPYAGVAAHLDAEERAAADAAQQIRLALATYFASPQPSDAIAPRADDGTAEDLLSDRMGVQRIQSPAEKAESPPPSDVPFDRDSPAQIPSGN